MLMAFLPCSQVKRHRPGYSSAQLRPRFREREVRSSRRLVCLFWRCRDNLRLSHGLQKFVGRQSEHEAKCRGHHELGSPIATYEQETAGGEVCQRQDRGFSIVCGYWLHGDMKCFAKRLIAIVQPQLQSDLCSAQLKTHLPCAFVQVCKRRFR